MKSPVTQNDPDAPVSKHAEVTACMRERILSGVYEPGRRLPTLHELAEEFGTSYFTVQTSLNPLADQGLIERKRRVGTVVSPNVNVLTRVGIYCGQEFLDDWNFAFYRTLCSELQRRLTARGVESRLYMDVRPPDRQTVPPEDLLQGVERRAVQALFVVLADRKSHAWIKKMEIPIVSQGTDLGVGCVNFSVEQMIDLAFQRLSQRGCHRVGLISSITVSAERPGGYQDFYALVASSVKKYGLELPAEWIGRPATHPENLEAFGYEAFKRLWSGTEKPDGFFIFPDTAARGVMTAMLEQGLRVPDDAVVVSHFNAGVDWTCPLAFDWVSSDVGEWAEAMIEEVLRQKAGQAPSRTLLDYTLEAAE